MEIGTLLAEKFSDLAVAIVGGATGAWILYFLGKRAFVNQRQREELYEIYVRRGLLGLQASISKAYAEFQYNYEVINSQLRYMRDYDPEHPRQPTLEALREGFVETRLPSEFLDSLNLVDGLLQSKCISSLYFQLMARLTAARIHHEEALLVLKTFLGNPKDFGDSPREYYEALSRGLGEDKAQVGRALVLSDYLGSLANRIFENHAEYTTLRNLKTSLARDAVVSEWIREIERRIEEIRAEQAKTAVWPPSQS